MMTNKFSDFNNDRKSAILLSYCFDVEKDNCKMSILNIFAGVMAVMSLNFSLHSTPVKVFSEGTCEIDGISWYGCGFCR